MSDRVASRKDGAKGGEKKNSKFDQSPPPIVSVAETKRETFARANVDVVRELKLR